MIETQLGPQRSNFVWPPSHANGMLRVFSRVPRAAANDVVVKLVSHSEECGWCNSEHCVIDDSPFQRVTGVHWKRATLKGHGAGWMGLRVIHIHVERFGRGVDLVVELVRPSSNDLLQIVVTELAVVKRVVASVDGIFLVWCCPLNHHR